MVDHNIRRILDIAEIVQPYFPDASQSLESRLERIGLNYDSDYSTLGLVEARRRMGLDVSDLLVEAQEILAAVMDHISRRTPTTVKGGKRGKRSKK